MERATVMKTCHGSQLTPKSPTLQGRDASFSSYLSTEDPINCRRHLTISSAGRCRALDDSTSELSIFDAQKYFNEVTSHDIQKLTISSNSRVSPLVNMNREHNPERDDIIRETSRFSSASSFHGYANIGNYRACSFHAATPTASSEASWNCQTGLLSQPAGAIPVSMNNPPHPADPNKTIRASFSQAVWLFCRKCPCSGKKSVEIREKTTDPKIQMPQTPPLRCLSHIQFCRDSLIPKRQNLDSTNPKIPIDKLAMNIQTTTAAANNPDTLKIPINSNNWAGQRRQSQEPEIIVARSQRSQPAEKNQLPAILQSQRVLASVRPFIDGFTFPVLKPQSSNSTVKLQVASGVDEDPARESLEVFRPSDIEPTPVSRKLTNKDGQDLPFPPSPKERIVEDDVASDASSDLFEIESFSTQTTSTCPIMYSRGDSIDEASNSDSKRLGTTNHGFSLGRRSADESITPTITECCDTSEASIDLSVTIAEGFDRASVANFSVSSSEIADDTSTIHCGGHRPDKCKRRVSSGNGFLSCRCEKAVSVGPQPVKCVAAGEGHRGATPLTSRHLGSRPAAASVNKPPLGRSQTARMSLPFAA